MKREDVKNKIPSITNIAQALERGPVGRTDKKPVKRGTGLTSRPHIAQTGAQTKRKGVTSYDVTPFLVGGKELESLTPCTSSRRSP